MMPPLDIFQTKRFCKCTSVEAAAPAGNAKD
jgi:hypothetical protein